MTSSAGTSDTIYKGYIDTFLTILIWSGFIVISKIGGKSVLLPYDIVALRFGTAALVLFPVWLMRYRVRLLQWKMLALAATGGAGYAMLVYTAFKFAPATHGSILISGILPFWITLFSWLLLNEKPSGRRMAGLAAIALGVAGLALGIFHHQSGYWFGDLVFTASSMTWGLYTVLVRKWNISVMDATVGNALLSAIIYLPVYLLLLPKHMEIAPWNAIAVQAFFQGIIVVIVAMILYMRAVEELGASKVGVWMATVPAISGLAAYALLGEPMTAFVALGLGLTSFGAWMGNRR